MPYCRMGNLGDVRTLANLATNSFSRKLQVANLVLADCSTYMLVLVSKFVQLKIKRKIAKIKRC